MTMKSNLLHVDWERVCWVVMIACLDAMLKLKNWGLKLMLTFSYADVFIFVVFNFAIRYLCEIKYMRKLSVVMALDDGMDGNDVEMEDFNSNNRQ